jgi:putative phosphoesterase
MKIAVLSDIHGNWPGLQAVADHAAHWQPDCVIVGGDVINRGPNSAKCWAFVQARRADSNWQVILGNHEEYVINQDKPTTVREGVTFDLYRPSFWVYEQLGRDVRPLEVLPFSIDQTFGDTTLRVTHASMLGTRQGIFPHTPDAALPELIGQPYPSLLVVGHTHQPLVRSSNSTLVVNAGAVGMPFDGDPRVSYAQLTLLHGKWRGEIIRLDYDRTQAERDFFDTGFIEGGGPLTRIMLQELRVASGRLYSFFTEFEPPILRGEISLERAVALFLSRE